jgi:putative phosphoribosyl transferase
MPSVAEQVVIPPLGLQGEFRRPRPGWGIVLFAHGSGSSRLSPRNRQVAEALAGAGLGTLLFDLLLPGEDEDRANVFDIELLAGRLLLASRWIEAQPDLHGLPIGYFGASTGAAAALTAAAENAYAVSAVVSRGGRPDLAGDRLAVVTAPTLLIVGSRDTPVIALNRLAYDQLAGPKALEQVEGAGHLFEEPGTLERVIDLARDWFVRHLAADTSAGIGRQGA